MRKQLTLIVLAAFVGMFLCPLAAYATKTCPGCGAEWPDDANFCGTCGTELISEVFGTPDIQKHLEYWDITGDVTLEEDVMCLSKGTPGKNRVFEITAEASIGDLSWTDYEVTGKVYFEPVEENDSKLFAMVFHENPKEKYLGGGGTGVLLLRPDVKPEFNDYPDDLVVDYSSLYEYKEGYVTVNTGRVSGLGKGLCYGAAGFAGLGAVFVGLAFNPENNDEEKRGLIIGGSTIAGVGLILLGIGFSLKEKTKTKERVPYKYVYSPGNGFLSGGEWYEFELYVKDRGCGFYLDGVEYVLNESISSERGPLSFESVDGCTVYLKDVRIDRLP